MVENNYNLNSTDKLTELVKYNGIHFWDELIEYVKCLPYGRNSNRTDFKVKYHKTYLNNWIKENNINLDFNQIWEIREKCIKNLTI